MLSQVRSYGVRVSNATPASGIATADVRIEGNAISQNAASSQNSIFVENGSPVDMTGVRNFLLGQNTAADAVASNFNGAPGFTGGGACATP